MATLGHAHCCAALHATNASVKVSAFKPDTDGHEVLPLLNLIGEGESAVDALLLRVPEVAAQLGISRAKVYELIAAGSLASVKVGGCRRIRSSDVQDFVDQLSRSGFHPPSQSA